MYCARRVLSRTFLLGAVSLVVLTSPGVFFAGGKKTTNDVRGHEWHDTVSDGASLRKRVLALAKLQAPPAVYPAEGIPAQIGLRALFYEALPYRGKSTRVFAWYGAPSKTVGKVPAVILVHGGGGTAFTEWVRLWNEHGFAALAIAVEGQTDQHEADGKTWQRHQWAGPARQGIYEDATEPLADQWMYHAVADVILAHSLLRSFPEVDSRRIGLVGISWGGVIVATVAGLDSRFSFAIPIYGCGHLTEAENQYGVSLARNQVYKEVWEPSLYLGHARMPILWLTELQDEHFPLNSQLASARSAPGPRVISVLPELKHSHKAGWGAQESYSFAESVVRKGQPGIRQTGHSNTGEIVSAEFETKRLIDSAVVVTTVDSGYTGKRHWTMMPADLQKLGGQLRVTARLAVGVRAYFFNLHSKEGITSSEFTETGYSKAVQSLTHALVNRPLALSHFCRQLTP